ncbi:MAG: hypothetical protein ACK5NF_00510 [Bacilli bacterium]
MNESYPLVTYSNYTHKNKYIYKIYYNTNYEGSLYKATNNLMEFDFIKMDSNTQFLNSNGIFGTTLTIDELNTIFGENQVKESNMIIDYKGFMYLNIGIITALIITTLIVNYLLCSYNRKEQSIMIIMGFSEQKVLKRSIKLILKLILFSIVA